MYKQGPIPSRLKFNSNYLFNEHFLSSVFFKSIFLRKTWRGGEESLLKNGTIDRYA